MTDRFLMFPRGIVFCLCIFCTVHELAADAPSPKQALGLRPVQKNVDFEKVPDEAVENCKVKDIARKGWTGWEVMAADGTMLRRFADTNGDKRIDLWCYYNFGVEVYRDIDADFNGKADQYRWLGTNGTRWGLDDDENGSIDRWKRISAEEVTAELIAALRDADGARFSRLLATEREFGNMGLGDDRAAKMLIKAKSAARDFESFAKRQKAVNASAKWVQFAAPAPGIVPATKASDDDLVVYENVVAMFEQDGKNGQLLVGTLVQVGNAWRLVDLPSIGSDGQPVAQAGSFFSQATNAMVAANATGSGTDKLVGSLESIDKQLASATKKTEIASLHQKRADMVEELIDASTTREEKETWVRQLVDTVSVAVQSGNYPAGVARLRKVAGKHARDNKPLAAYADYTAIASEYTSKQTKDADFEKVQEWYLDALNGFIDRYPKTLESAQAMMQIALSSEFEDDEREALKYYRKVATTFPRTDVGEKAAGAVRRLDSVGRRIDLEGKTLDGKDFSLAGLRGSPVVVHYWATWCEPCKNDMKKLRYLQAQYTNLKLVGVNVDALRDDAVKYVNESKLSWTQLFESGGLEASRLANTFGVQTLPTMMLIDGSGKVVRHNVRVAELSDELEKLEKK